MLQFGSNYIGKCQDNNMKNGEWWRDNGHNMVVNKTMATMMWNDGDDDEMMGEWQDDKGNGDNAPRWQQNGDDDGMMGQWQDDKDNGDNGQGWQRNGDDDGMMGQWQEDKDNGDNAPRW
jgi:hypothetical protein